MLVSFLPNYSKKLHIMQFGLKLITQEKKSKLILGIYKHQNTFANSHYIFKGYSSLFFLPSLIISASSSATFKLTNGNIRTSNVDSQSLTANRRFHILQELFNLVLLFIHLLAIWRTGVFQAPIVITISMKVWYTPTYACLQKTKCNVPRQSYVF